MAYLTVNLEGNVATIQTTTTLEVSFAICKVATHILQLFKLSVGTLLTITTYAVILTALLRTQLVT